MNKHANSDCQAGHQLKAFQRISFEDLSVLSAVNESRALHSYGKQRQDSKAGIWESAGTLLQNIRENFRKTIDNIFFETVCDEEVYAAMERTVS